MESSMHDVKILQSENPRVPTDRHQTSLSNIIVVKRIIT